MSLYSQMRGIPGTSSQAYEPVQRELKRLLRHLSWSYVALWSFNHQTSNLRWRGGHFRVNSTEFTLHSDTEVWNEHLFNSKYKSCTFASGQGSVGTAYAETRNIWMNGPSIHRSAGSEEQAQFLINAGIKTAVCIPWAESVLELGTCETMAEDLDLTAGMCIFLSEHILPALTQAPPDFPQTSLAVSRTMMQSSPFPLLNPTRHLSNKFVAQDFEMNSLNEQIRRSSSLSSLNTDMFLPQLEEGEAGKELTTRLDTGVASLTDPRWRAPTTTSRAADNQLQTQKPPLPAPNQALMSAIEQIYRSQSGTTSSSVSLSEDSIRLPVDSPEHTNMSLVASGKHCKPPRRETPSLSPEVQMGETSTATGIIPPTQNLRLEDEIQQAINHMLVEGDTQVQQWRDMYMNPSREPGIVLSEENMLDSSTMPSMITFHSQDELSRHAFKSWRHTHVLQRNDGSSQALLRRSFEMMKRISILRSKSNLQGPRASSSTSPEIDLPDVVFDDTFDQNAPLRGQRRPRGAKTAIAGSGHEVDAATNHMLAERRRRIKQKESFASLRKLVPIISKADKASILGDAILYIKDLQERVKEMESSRAETESRYENLIKAHQELEQRNKELEAMAAGHGGGASSSKFQQRPSTGRPEDNPGKEKGPSQSFHETISSDRSGNYTTHRKVSHSWGINAFRAPLTEATPPLGNPSNITMSLAQRWQFVSGSFVE